MKISCVINDNQEVEFVIFTTLKHGYPNCGSADEYEIEGRGYTLEEASINLTKNIKNKMKQVEKYYERNWFSTDYDGRY